MPNDLTSVGVQLGDLLSGDLARRADERGALAGAKSGLISNQSAKAMAEAASARIQQFAREAYASGALTGEPLGRAVVAAGWGPGEAAYQQALLRKQENELRALSADPATSALRRTRALGAVQGKPYSDLEAVGKGFTNITKDVPTVEPIGDAGGLGADLPNDVAVYEYYSKLSDPEKLDFLRSKRGIDRVTELGGVPTNVTSGPRTTLTPLSTLEAETGAAARKRAAEATAANDVERAKTAESNTRAFDTYQVAMNQLTGAMANTTTNPLTGLLPAITAEQQIAEGSVATMTPVLKQLFRGSGEGTFTDKDQEMLLAMVPKRTDHPEARKAKVEMINEIVAAKLGIAKPGATAPSGVTPAPRDPRAASAPPRGARAAVPPAIAAPSTTPEPVRVNSPAEARALPVGTEFITPDGRLRRVR